MPSNITSILNELMHRQQLEQGADPAAEGMRQIEQGEMGMMEAGVPSLKGIGAKLLNLVKPAESTFAQMSKAGKFAGERTTGSFDPTNLLTGAQEGLAKWGPELARMGKPAVEEAGHYIPEMAARGGEAAFNAAQAGGRMIQKVTPSMEEAVLRYLRSAK